MDWLKKAHEARCEGKQAFRSAQLADKLAAKASNKLGELVISYECCDCGWWHIGHADPTQQKTHRPIEQMFCGTCKKFIPEQRWKVLHDSGATNFTCSKQCSKRLSRLNAKAGKILQKESQSQPGPPSVE